MKKLFTLIAFIGLALGAKAQHTCDLKVQAFGPASFGSLDTFNVYYVVTNLGPDSFKANSDTLLYYLNGNFAGGYIKLAMAVNQSDTFALTLNSAAYSHPADSTRQICIEIRGLNTSADSVIDHDLTNNESCISIVQLDVKNVTSNIGDISMYPNPAQSMANFDVKINQSASVSVKVYDMIGREVYSNNAGKLNSGKHTFSMSTNELANGIYIYQVIVGDETKTGKFNVAK
ncbi:MAG: T9SS type A sorting domain-containing protein [Bacteroidetes bacterium]|nr:T9SS type A sorting domain-containing protein [Bacteroidota bacterium]